MAQTLVKFDLASLATMDDGRIAAAVASEVSRIVADLKDRPKVKTVRKLQIEVGFAPVVSDAEDSKEAVCTLAATTVQVTSSVPKRKKGYVLGLSAENDTAFYSQNNPSDVRQTSIFDATVQQPTTPV